MDEDWADEAGAERLDRERDARAEAAHREAQAGLRALAERDRRQAAHERPPRGVTREEWLETFPTVEDYDAADERIWGKRP